MPSHHTDRNSMATLCGCEARAALQALCPFCLSKRFLCNQIQSMRRGTLPKQWSYECVAVASPRRLLAGCTKSKLPASPDSMGAARPLGQNQSCKTAKCCRKPYSHLVKGEIWPAICSFPIVLSKRGCPSVIDVCVVCWTLCPLPLSRAACIGPRLAL